MEFVGHVPVLYGARAVGWTSLCTSRTAVIVNVVGYGMVFVPMVRRLVGVLSLLFWRSQVYLALCGQPTVSRLTAILSCLLIWTRSVL